ncbi:MAG: hypothetical protein KZQ75_10210 [Candidatus Thiodiazotropha sp. (ex Myrtea spinifera)]|nr:hypothetical protein [Candidatus Thiodiazotropha sp. (ex Myrtea spinifera)]MCU7828122.1 hypothetical protein [Candidatus Thiodiazotropha sp. (ex Myrtea sp. 'scaly one' KF741663)]
MSNLLSKYSVVIASDVGDRDGIGIEVSLNEDLILEIFRDDTKKTREVTLYKKELPLELIEESIEKFKKEIPWEYQD